MKTPCISLKHQSRTYQEVLKFIKELKFKVGFFMFCNRQLYLNFTNENVKKEAKITLEYEYMTIPFIHVNNTIT